MNYSLKLLYSGSDGNAALLRVGDAAILIDAGRTAKSLCGALAAEGISPDSLQAIFLTHEHRDHTAALDVFIKHHPVPVHMTAGCAVQLRRFAGEALSRQIVEHPPLFTVDLGCVSLCSFPTLHDSEGSVGYHITVREGEVLHHLGYATDLGVSTPAVEQALLGCEAVVIECNHDEDMLQTGPYPYPLKRRIASRYGHLSNTDCAALCAKLAANGTKRFLLAHLSETNNLPDLALGEVRAALAGFSAEVRAAHPIYTTEL